MKIDRVASTRSASKALCLLAKLRTLELGSIKFRRGDEGTHWVGTVIANNVSSLRHLKLGSERWVIESMLTDMAALSNMDQRTTCRSLIRSIKQELAATQKDGQRLQLESLHLCGLDLRELIDVDGPKLFQLDDIRELSLESCEVKNSLNSLRGL